MIEMSFNANRFYHPKGQATDMSYRLLVSLIAMVLTPIACVQTKAAVPLPSTSCDVVNEDFCFGLPHGGAASLSIPIDFKLYDINLANGQKALVYYGSQPESPDKDHVLVVSRRTGAEVVSLYTKGDGDQKVTDLYYEKKREKFTIFVHVGSSYRTDQRQAFISFLASFRKCNSPQKDLVECTADQLFVDALNNI